MGGKILTLQKYNTESNDFLTQLTKIKDSTSDALFIVPQSALKGGLIVKQAKELNLLIPFFGTAQFNGQDALDAGKESLNGLEYVDTPILNQNNIVLVDGDVKTIANAIIDNVYTNTQLQVDLDNLIDTKI